MLKPLSSLDDQNVEPFVSEYRAVRRRGKARDGDGNGRNGITGDRSSTKSPRVRGLTAMLTVSHHRPAVARSTAPATLASPSLAGRSRAGPIRRGTSS